MGEEVVMFHLHFHGQRSTPVKETTMQSIEEKQLYACLFAGVNPNISRSGIVRADGFPLARLKDK
jgi:hypothetical protein